MINGAAREIALIDANQAKAAGECMDLNHGLSFTQPAKISFAGFEGCKDSDIVVITAGARQRPGQGRLDLVQANIEIFRKIIPDIVKHAPDAILINVTNPLDVLTYVTLKLSGFPKQRVCGSGTLLDSSRFRYLISDHCRVDPRNVHAYIIGEHGDTELPVWSNANIGGMKIDQYCFYCKNNKSCPHRPELDKLFDEVKNAAYKIIEAKGATYYAVALALVRITEAILRDENSVLPLSTLIDGYCGIKDVCLSLPSIVNRGGVERVLNLDLSETEQKLFQHSAQTIKEIIKQSGF
jgi:L-lactate dehydrogenase